MSGRPPELQSPVEGMASESLPSGAQALGLAPAAASWLDRLPGGVFQLHRDVDGRWTFPYVNAEMQRLLGMSGAGLRRDARAVRAVLNPVDLAQLKKHLDQSRETGVTWKARVRLLRQNGSHPWVEVTASPESRADASTVWFGFLTDVQYEQSRRQAANDLHERQMRAIRAAALGLIDIDLLTQRVRLDPQARQQHGLNAVQTEVSLLHWLDLLVPEDRVAARLAVTTPLGDVEYSSQTVVVRLSSPDRATSRTLELTVTAAWPHGDTTAHAANPARRICVCRDITKQKQQEEERCQKISGVLAERSRNDFLSRVSHELRTPLNGILGYAQLMALDREHPLPRTQSQRLRVLQESSTRLLSMIDQLLEVDGIDQGQVGLHPEVVDLGPLIARCVSHAQPLAQAKGIDIEIALADDDRAHVRADPKALEQVIHELLSNAIKFNRSPGRVRIRYVSAEMGTVIIDDTGPGLTTQQLSQLFQPLNRLGAERTSIPGHGLGLTTARKLTQAMGGKLKAWSQPGTGSRFAVSLMLSKPERPVGAPESDFAGLAHSQWDGGMQRVVLYIEDDEVNTTLMEQVFLMRPEWRLVTAADGEEGILAAMTHLPELALIDIGLPDISGIEVMRRIKGNLRTQQIHCVALSADTSTESVERARTAGFEDYWTKPFDILTMVNQLKNLLVS